MPENAPYPAGPSGQRFKPERSVEGILADLIVRYHRYPSVELARMIRQLETELVEAALLHALREIAGAVRERNGNS